MFILHWQKLLPIFYSRSYCHVVVVDVVTTYYCYLPILQGGRCYCLCICGRMKNHKLFEHGCFSFCLVIMLSVDFLNNRTNFC